MNLVTNGKEGIIQILFIQKLLVVKEEVLTFRNTFEYRCVFKVTGGKKPFRSLLPFVQFKV